MIDALHKASLLTYGKLRDQKIDVPFKLEYMLGVKYDHDKLFDRRFNNDHMIKWSTFANRMRTVFRMFPLRNVTLPKNDMDNLKTVEKSLEEDAPIEGEMESDDDDSDFESDDDDPTPPAKRHKMAFRNHPSSKVFDVMTLNDVPCIGQLRCLKVVLLQYHESGSVTRREFYVLKDDVERALEVSTLNDDMDLIEGHESNCVVLSSISADLRTHKQGVVQRDILPTDPLFTEDVQRDTLKNHLKKSIPKLFDMVMDENDEPKLPQEFHTEIGERFEKLFDKDFYTPAQRVLFDAVHRMPPLLFDPEVVQDIRYITSPFVTQITFTGYRCLYRSYNHTMGAADVAEGFAVYGHHVGPKVEPPLGADPSQRARALYGYKILEYLNDPQWSNKELPTPFSQEALQHDMGYWFDGRTLRDIDTSMMNEMTETVIDKLYMKEMMGKEEVLTLQEAKDNVRTVWIAAEPPPNESDPVQNSIQTYCAAISKTVTEDQLLDISAAS